MTLTPQDQVSVLAQLKEAVEHIRARKPNATYDDALAEAGERPFECLWAQRKHLENALRRARQSIGSPATFPNEDDYHTHVELAYANIVALEFCNVRDAQGTPLANNVDELAQRCLKAEADLRKQGQVISELQAHLNEGGPGRGK
jgi:hypothetical protein